MPWKESKPTEEIIRFAALAASGQYTMVELCEQFGISRKTGHKHLERYREAGVKGLYARSRRPEVFARQTDEQVEQLVLKERTAHRTWGPKKLYEILLIKHGIEQPPARSTIAAILKRNGLSECRRRRPGFYAARPSELTAAVHPNHVWSVDFKGWFLTKDGRRCDPLTVCDRFSRYVLSCQAQPNQQFKGALRVFKAMMRHHGLPEIIRVDNGAPFASNGVGRLSQLSVWWINQGIEVEFTRPGCPQDNGAHERMHRDLKAEVAQPPSVNLAAQQRRFERWQYQFNHERPHEALGMKKPAELYHRSARRLREDDSAVSYPANYLTKCLSESGLLAYEGHNYYIGEALACSRVGLIVDAAGTTQVHFANIHLGHLVYDPAQRWRAPAYIVPPPR
jgi:transposase InsO family protein